MTDVETHSTAPSGGKHARWVISATARGGVVVTILSAALLVAPRVTAADPLSTAQAQAAQIVSQLQVDSAHVDVLSQDYEVAQGRVTELQSEVQRIHTTIALDEQQVRNDAAGLRHQAVVAYVSSGNDTELESLFTTNAQAAAAANEYRSVATGNVSSAVANLRSAERALATQQQQLDSTQGQAQAQLDAASSTKAAADSAVAAQKATLANLNGQLASMVAQQQAAQQASQHAAFLAQTHAAQSVPAAGGAAGAVQAAQSQIGVPYAWGAEQPGVAFDCSGLTQWAWRQAGVSIPRTAQAQYDAIPHVPLGAMEPGDLVFWGDSSGIYHVGMYVGNGNVVHAPHTGADVQITPIWNSDLVGAGRP